MLDLSHVAARGTLGTRFLAVGFACTLLLSVVTLGVAAIEFSDVEQATLETADDSYSTYHLANVGEELARLRAHVALGLSESPEEFARHAGRIAGNEARLQASMDAIPATLDPVSRSRWERLKPQIERLQRVYADAAAAIRTDRPVRAAELVRQELPVATGVHDTLDDLERTHREAVLAELRSVHRSASSMAIVEIGLAGVFLLGMIGIFAVMLRLLQRQKRRLAEYTACLESANADLDAFAGRVAHDLRNALGPLVLGSSLLQQASGDGALVLKAADRIDRASRRAIAIVDALLALSRAARAAETGESGAVRPAVTNVLEELAPLAARLDASIEVEELPDVHVRCSPGLLHIVLANLCGNAVKYLDGQPERRVRISAHAEGSSCRIVVEDTGPGIPADAREKIFEPFYRVAGTRAPGSGIGLATVRRIVDARGGRVAVEPAAGRTGARFQVWLPLAPPSADPPPDAGGAAR